MNIDLEDPRSYAAVRRPALEASSLPPACYHDAAFHARENERVFRRCWNFLDHDDRAANAGDWFSVDIAGVPLLVVRGEDGEVRAFANSCRHRGCRVANGNGNTRHLRCPYHGWTYDLAGRLRGAPQMLHSHGFRLEDHALVPVRLEAWGRLLWVCLDPATPPLREWMGELWDLLAPYRFDDLVCVRRRRIDIACNWKVYFENLMEPYHTPFVHAGGMADKNEDEGATMLSGNAGEALGTSADAPVRLAHGVNWSALISRHAGSRGLLPGDQPLPPRPGLTGPAAEGSIWTWLFPGTAFSCQREAMWWNRLIPNGPGSVTLELGSCFPSETTRHPEFERLVHGYYRRLDQTAAEDLHIVLEQQAGLESPLALAGRVCHLEAVCHAQRNWLLDRMLT